MSELVKIFVGGFPLDITEMELAMLLSPYGTVVTIKIVRDKKTRLCKGYAFVEMEDDRAAANVIAALDGTEMKDRVLSIKITTGLPAPKPQRSSNYRKPYNYSSPR